ncbi:MAG TPA: CheR family methyltransferase [Kofleriaceae bacterium]|nr:CheR family methyltransferase [Kofleriaceae bacterium]
MRRVGDRVAAHAGLRPPEWVLEARLARRIAALGLARPEAYASLLESGDGARELELLIESLRVGETRFFRHRGQVQAVTDVVVPALAESRSGGPVRAWSAGCASGEEPYTLAILLSRGLPPPAYQVSVLGTDISERALAVARAGEYPARSLDAVPGELRKYFQADAAERVTVAPQVKKLVSFEAHNLADPGYPPRMDLIWCRNVLIYFSPEARRQVVLRLIDCLAPGGFLFVGYAESLRDFQTLEAVQTPDGVLYRKAAAPARPRTAVRAAAAAVVDPAPVAPTGSGGLSPVEREEAVVELHGRYEDASRLSRELTPVLGGSYRRVVIELDGADYLGDDAGAVLRRACSAARSAGVEVVLVADRQATRRWLARSGAGEDGGDA